MPKYKPTATAPPYSLFDPVVKDLITPGLVPDIARQSAEVSAGRGIYGSPAGDSTAVRMSEQNYLQRLALANSLLSGDASRTLPYQITPYQSAGLNLQSEGLENQREIAKLHYGTGGVQRGGGSSHPSSSPQVSTPWAGFMNSPWGPAPDTAYRGTRPDSSGSGGGILSGGYDSSSPTLDDMLAELGISGGGFGTGDDTGYDDGYFGDFYE